MMLNAYNLTIWRHWHHVIVLYLCYPVLSCFIVFYRVMFRNCSTWEVQWFPAPVQPSNAGTTALACAGVQYSSHHFAPVQQEIRRIRSKSFRIQNLWISVPTPVTPLTPVTPGRPRVLPTNVKHWQNMATLWSWSLQLMTKPWPGCPMMPDIAKHNNH